jgi:hypothetical protein
MTVLDGIRSAQSGATIEVATTGLDLPSVTRALRWAVLRGVHVRLVAAGPAPTAQEERIARVTAASGDPDSWVHRCADECLETYAAEGFTRGFLLVSDATGAWQARYDAYRKLSSYMLTRRTRVQVHTGPFALEQGAQMFAALG